MGQMLDQFIEDLSDIETIDGARSLMINTLADIGVERFVYLGLHIPDANLADPVHVHTYSDEWVDRYLSSNYANIDPVVKTGMQTIVPFVWGGDTQRKALNDESRAMMDEATDFGLSRGLTVPIHGAQGELAALTVVLPEHKRDALDIVETFGHQIHLMGLHFHASMGEKVFSNGANRHAVLSKREVECLVWASQGKTTWETGEILNISEYTVREYVKCACKKLGVYSKSHAVVKSIMLGLVRPNIC